MNLKTVLTGVPVSGEPYDAALTVSGVAYDSRKVRTGMLFVCMEGFVTDGHRYVAQAVELGAVAVLAQKPVRADGVPVLYVPDTRSALARVSRNFYSDPCARMDLIGVTGTSGKTSISFLLHAILSRAGKTPGLIGPVANIVGGTPVFSLRTTPESVDLMAILDEMASAGSQSAVMEVSSQGIRLKRVSACSFSSGIFSNLYSNYIRIADPPGQADAMDTKRDFARQCETVVVNLDAEYADVFLRTLDRPVCTYGLNRQADVRADNLRPGRLNGRMGTFFRLETPWFTEDVFLGLPTAYQVANALGAVAAAGLAGVGPEAIREALADAVIPGCVQPVGRPGDRIYVDDARTPDRLATLLAAMRPYTPGKLLCLFGCDGNSTRAGRAAVGAVVSRLADGSVIAPNNPYAEDPEHIAQDILQGFAPGAVRPDGYNDRKDAIRALLEQAGPDDVVLLTGRGARAYQMFGNRTLSHRDEDWVNELRGQEG